jgi:hypothetical protein
MINMGHYGTRRGLAAVCLLRLLGVSCHPVVLICAKGKKRSLLSWQGSLGLGAALDFIDAGKINLAS